MKKSIRRHGIFISVCALALSVTASFACTRVFWNTNKQAMVVARTMDLFRSDEAVFTVFPRGIQRDGLPGDANSVKWKSQYGSTAIVCFENVTADGLNEKGLQVSLLYLGDSDYEKRDAQRAGLSYSLWAQYFLDNCSTVQEALDKMKTFQVVPVEVAGKQWPLHLSLADATGDSAIIEFIKGKMV
ncbi:MAG: linear amide C-N hydrolase, partial [Chthoniobacterales bacterium]